MKAPFIRNPYNYDTEKASQDAAYVETSTSLTIQSQTLETDINEIVRRVGIGAPMPTNTRIPEYGDYTEIRDFRSALEAVANAESHFMQLPAAVRAQFQNDPQEFLQFCTTPGNDQKLMEWGLRRPAEAPGATIVTPPATTGTPPAPGAPNAPGTK